MIKIGMGGVKVKYCAFCGAGLHDDMIFCPKCGKKFHGAVDGTAETDLSDAAPIHIPKQDTCAVERTEADVHEPEHTDTSNGAGHDRIPPKKAKWPLLLACVAVLSILIGGYVLIGAIRSNAGTDQNDPEQVASGGVTPSGDPDSESISVTEAAASVLYLEVYNDSDTVVSTASGFVVGDGTTLITNFHVIDDAYRIVARTPDGELFTTITKVLNYDVTADLAVLRCNSDLGVTPLTLADSDTVKQGDEIYAAGYPLGLAHTLSDGVVSSRYIDEDGVDIIQITAAISGGSSGGALLNTAGQVIGVITAYYIDGQNLNVAVASNSALELIEDSASEGTALSSLYAENNAYGRSSFSLTGGVAVEDRNGYYFYEARDGIYRVDQKFGNRRFIVDGDEMNVYKGNLYYGANRFISRCNYNGGDREELIEIPEGKYLVGMLVAEGCIFARLLGGDTCDLYVVDLETLEVLDHIENVWGLAYFENNLYMSTDEPYLIQYNMNTFEVELFPTSCDPVICGVDEIGSIYYYADNDASMRKGIYIFDPVTGSERTIKVNTDEPGKNIIREAAVYDGALYIVEMWTSEDFICQMRVIHPDGTVELWEQGDDYFISGVCPELGYFYTSEGTTIEILTGEIVGEWVFE